MHPPVPHGVAGNRLAPEDPALTRGVVGGGSAGGPPRQLSVAGTDRPAPASLAPFAGARPVLGGRRSCSLTDHHFWRSETHLNLAPPPRNKLLHTNGDLHCTDSASAPQPGNPPHPEEVAEHTSHLRSAFVPAAPVAGGGGRAPLSPSPRRQPTSQKRGALLSRCISSGRAGGRENDCTFFFRAPVKTGPQRRGAVTQITQIE
eukprot:gene9556-biopygen1688